MVFNVFICFLIFVQYFSFPRWRKLAACAQFKIQNSEFRIQNLYIPLANFKSLPKFFFSITLKEHLEAQLHYTLWQTLRVCQSFFHHKI